mgnify:CR=1 FL=1
MAGDAEPVPDPRAPGAGCSEVPHKECMRFQVQQQTFVLRNKLTGEFVRKPCTPEARLCFDEDGHGYISDKEQQTWVKYLLKWSAWSSQSGRLFVVHKRESAVELHWLDDFIKTKRQFHYPVPSVVC